MGESKKIEEKAPHEQGARKTKKGIVISNKMDKTVVVKCLTTLRHPQYDKVISRSKKYYAHYDNPKEPLQVGDSVTIMETRPLSKLKRWRVVSTTVTA
jgi:small subunit ribosomal protein S17